MGGAEDVEEGQEVVGVAVLVLPFDAAQVVDDVAAAHDEVALLAQAGELLAELVGGVLGDVAVDGELDDGDVGLGEDVDEDAPTRRGRCPSCRVAAQVARARGHREPHGLCGGAAARGVQPDGDWEEVRVGAREHRGVGLRLYRLPARQPSNGQLMVLCPTADCRWPEWRLPTDGAHSSRPVDCWRNHNK